MVWVEHLNTGVGIGLPWQSTKLLTSNFKLFGLALIGTFSDAPNVRLPCKTIIWMEYLKLKFNEATEPVQKSMSTDQLCSDFQLTNIGCVYQHLTV